MGLFSSSSSSKGDGRRQDFGYSRTVSYNNSKNLSIILQRRGSINRKVFPFVAGNLVLSVVLVWLLNHGIDLTISEFGHEFMSVLVSFLVINKLSFSLSLYYELQGYLAKMNQAGVDLTQVACGYTIAYKSQEYKEWRLEVTRLTLVLLKTMVIVVFKGGKKQAWEIPELIKDPPILTWNDEHDDDDSIKGSFRKQLRQLRQPERIYEFGHDLPSDKNLRVPIRIAQRLRNAIIDRSKLPTDPLDTIQERYLLDSVKELMESYYGIRKYLTCPLPLPIVQMSRIFVIFYVFTLPFALLSSQLNLAYVQMILLVLLMTYAFIGMEMLYVEIDDPFADDPNDLPLTEEGRAAGEDIILNLLYADGKEAVNRLRQEIIYFKKFKEGKLQKSTLAPEPQETDHLV